MRVPSSRVWLVGVPLTFAVVHYSDEAGAAVRCAPIPGVAADVGQACEDVAGDFLSRLDNPRFRVDILPEDANAILQCRSIVLDEIPFPLFESDGFRLVAEFAGAPDDPVTLDRDESLLSLFGVTGSGAMCTRDFNLDVERPTELEFSGYQLGPFPSDVLFRRRFASNGSFEEEFLESFRVRTHPETIIVPVSVVVATNSDGAPSLTFEEAQLLFDDVPLHTVATASPAYVFASATLPFREPAIEGFLRPDAVFAKCGIQFRMVEYAAVPTPSPLLQGTAAIGTLGPTSPCTDELAAFYEENYGADGLRRVSISESQILDPGASPSAVNCVFSEDAFAASLNEKAPARGLWIAAQSKVATETIDGVEVGYGRSMFDAAGRFTGAWRSGVPLQMNHNGPIVVVTNYVEPSDSDLEGANNGGGRLVFVSSQKGDEAVLSHEIGHSLGAGHLCAETATSCDVNGLMRNRGFSTNIQGCSTWSSGPLPPGCVEPDYQRTPTECLTMRDGAELRTFGLPPAPEPDSPPWFKLEAPEAGEPVWRLGRNASSAPVAYDTTRSSAGASSLVVPPGYTEISSPGFKTADLVRVGSELSVDVFVPASPANPWWVGSLALATENAAASSYLYLGIRDLTPLPRGAWTTVTFPVPESLRAILLGDFPAQRLFLIPNGPSNEFGLRLDNLRFSGSVECRTVFHREALATSVRTSPFLSFESQPLGWSNAQGLVTVMSGGVTDGVRSLRVVSGGWVPVISRLFTSAELPAVGARLGVDVFIPDPQPNPWWTGDVHAYVACPGVGLYNSWIGRQSLTNLFVGEFNHLSFPLTIEMQNALASGAECHLEFALNANGDSDGFLFDRVGFE